MVRSGCGLAAFIFGGMVLVDVPIIAMMRLPGDFAAVIVGFTMLLIAVIPLAIACFLRIGSWVRDLGVTMITSGIVATVTTLFLWVILREPAVQNIMRGTGMPEFSPLVGISCGLAVLGLGYAIYRESLGTRPD